MSLPFLLNPSLSLEEKIKALIDWYQCPMIPLRKAVLPFWILWRLWKSKNTLVFQRQSNSWRGDLRGALQDTEDWITMGLGHVQDSSHSQHQYRVPSTTYWQKPKEGWIKCNYDGSFLNQYSKATAAWIFRDENGVFIAAGQATGGRVSSALEAECQSVLFAFQNAWTKGFRKVVLEGDCQILVNTLQGKCRRFDVFNWISDIKEWCNRFEEIEFSWVKREANVPADQMAKHQHNASVCFKSHSIIPIDFIDVILSDSVSRS